MSKKAKRIITTFLPVMLLLMNLFSNSSSKINAQIVSVINPKPEVYVLVPGETTKLKVPIRAVGSYIKSPIIIADVSGTPYSTTQPALWSEGVDVPMNTIYESFSQYVEFDVTVKETAKIGTYPIKLIIYGETHTPDGVEQVQTELLVNTQVLVEKEPAQLSVNKVSFNNAIIGKEMKLSFTVKNEGEMTARNVFVSIDYADTGMIAAYPTKNIKVSDIEKQRETLVSLPIQILPTAKPGLNSLAVKLTHKTDDGTTITDSYDVYVNLKENESAPNLILDGYDHIKSVKPGEKLGLTITIKNDGTTTAYNPRLSIDESSIGTSKFIKDYFTEYIELKNIKPDNSIKVDVPISVAKDTTKGLKDLKLNFVYFDEAGVEYKSAVTIYPDIEAEGVTEDGTPVIIISNVNQTPEKPEAGGNLSVSFDIENKSAKDLNDFKIGLKDMSGSAFVPVDSDPYQYIGVLKAGTTQRVTLNMTVAKKVQEGANTLSLAYSYTGGGDSINIPILNVVNDLGSASKPRLIISNYEADATELKAGSVFNFNFEVHNTHSSVAAKNIIISISGKTPNSQSEIFTVTQGSNSFFVNRINPGETISRTLEMKVKSDAATMAYPILVTIEYEYDGIEPNPQTGEIGETEKHELLLQVVENARPVVDNIQVYSWDGAVTLGNPATMSFEFYNMGKSALNNVIAYVEGDFTRANGEMHFIGNINAGESSWADFEVIPNVEGEAKGIVKITYEDSNGDEQVYTKEFEAFVMGEQAWGPAFENGDMDVFNPILPEPKKVILPIWAFILAQIAIFVIFVPVSRKVIINVYKNKLRKQEEGMY